MTDNRVYDPNLGIHEVRDERSGVHDDRWVFTEDNPRRELEVSAGLAAAARAMKIVSPCPGPGMYGGVRGPLSQGLWARPPWVCDPGLHRTPADHGQDGVSETHCCRSVPRSSAP